ncbi:MAG: hypothetical protein O9264_11935 [Leptospira sp.]|nr:hypothetical protein [Leptospira sp.]
MSSNPSYSNLMEIDAYPGYTLPGGASNKSWNYLYDQKDGKILFTNTADPTSFMTISGNTNANLSGQKERGYFEYLIKNN